MIWQNHWSSGIHSSKLAGKSRVKDKIVFVRKGNVPDSDIVDN